MNNWYPLGGGYLNVSGGKFTSIGGDTTSVTNLNNQLIGGGQVEMPSAPFADLGVAEATSGFAVGFTSTDLS